MPNVVDQATSRRHFLKFLAGSPLFAYGGLSAFAGEGPTPGVKLPDPLNGGRPRGGRSARGRVR